MVSLFPIFIEVSSQDARWIMLLRQGGQQEGGVGVVKGEKQKTCLRAPVPGTLRNLTFAGPILGYVVSKFENLRGWGEATMTFKLLGAATFSFPVADRHYAVRFLATGAASLVGHCHPPPISNTLNMGTVLDAAWETFT